MANFEYHLYSYLSDNYGVLLHNKKTGDTISIDAGEASSLLSVLKEKAGSYLTCLSPTTMQIMLPDLQK